MRLSQIERMFSEGGFQAPLLIHDPNPPGMKTLQRLKTAVSFRFENLGSLSIQKAVANGSVSLPG